VPSKNYNGTTFNPYTDPGSCNCPPEISKIYMSRISVVSMLTVAILDNGL